MGIWTCSKCQIQWESDENCNRISGKPVCSDCYYEDIGTIMEKHPPINPHFVQKIENQSKSKKSELPL